MDSPKKDNKSTPQKKEHVTSRRYPTNVGIKKEPKFPKEVISPTALPTRAYVCGNSTGIARTTIKTPTVHIPTRKAENHKAVSGSSAIEYMAGPATSPNNSMKGFLNPTLSESGPITKDATRKPMGSINVASHALLDAPAPASAMDGNHTSKVS